MGVATIDGPCQNIYHIKHNVQPLLGPKHNF